ncbi:hypothetical protein Nepgr_013614 [Nepenthes gracilis]|uniref:Ubiquitin carboxyl-terminal hydrolase 18-like n=1 Tax=Nepenthes gracilis TaxID=150966 RepID=A0AAD3XP59_NEPGR|nr:hypothetical protein Nepgr_013614 [Nepenthes gracilis]
MLHVSAFSLDLNWFLQFLFTAFVVSLGLLHLLKNTASKYFVVDASFDSSDSASSTTTTSSLSPKDSPMPGLPHSVEDERCAVCGKSGSKKCSRCKAVRYCSQTCQVQHWQSEHKRKCQEFELSGGGGKRGTSIALVPSSGPCQMQKQPEKVLFPYDEFVKLFNWDNPGFPPCGLLNCGNSCFANVVLQCLVHTRPLLAYLLDKGHRRGCKRNEWCFFCELQVHVERTSRSQHPFSPINILSRLPSIGGNLGYGKQEDAHEFMRFAIDTMQSACLDEHGGEKVVHPKSQETTLIQHIFGGQLQSQVICVQCNQVSNQYENMMDLTVEIQGDATSLEECLHQFTVKEWLHGDNMYKCDGCNDYVKAWKRLTIRQAPNILTIALKRFQSGRFGKLNKRITFPEYLDLSPYMSEEGDSTDKYRLYAVVVHVDMLNASFFGHYICYTKDFQGNWYRIDDCKVMRVELEEVLSQGAYMLLYSRVSARPTCLGTFRYLRKKQEESDKASLEAEQCGSKQLVNFSNSTELANSNSDLNCLPSIVKSRCPEPSSGVDCEFSGQDTEGMHIINPESSSQIRINNEVYGNGDLIDDRILSTANAHSSFSSFISSVPSSSNGRCVISGAVNNGVSRNGVVFREIGPLASSNVIVASASDLLTPDETAPISTNESPGYEGTSEKAESENDLPISGSTDVSVAMKRSNGIAYRVNGKCNRFGVHHSVTDYLDGNAIVEERPKRGTNHMVMDDDDVELSRCTKFCNGEAGAIILDETDANCGQGFALGKTPPHETSNFSHIGNGTFYSLDNSSLHERDNSP